MALHDRTRRRDWPNPSATIAVAPATVYVLALLAGPFLLLVYLSFHEYNALRGYVNTYTLQNYLHLTRYQAYADSLIGTAKLGVVITLLSIIVGYPIAHFIARSRSHFVPLVTAVVVMPMFVSVVVRGFGWMVLLGRNGPVNQLLVTAGVVDQPVQFLYTWGAVVVSLVHIELPLAILPIAAVLRGMDRSLEDAARSLGASGPRMFWTVVLPLSLPGVAAGALLVFSHAIAAFILPALLGSQKIKLMSTMIYQQVMVIGNVPLGAALSVVMILATFFLIGVVKVTPYKFKA